MEVSLNTGVKHALVPTGPNPQGGRQATQSYQRQGWQRTRQQTAQEEADSGGLPGCPVPQGNAPDDGNNGPLAGANSDQISVSTTSFMMFTRTAPTTGIAQSIIQVSRAWHTQREADPASLALPHRAIMFQHVLSQAPAQKADLHREALEKAGWLAQDPQACAGPGRPPARCKKRRDQASAPPGPGFEAGSTCTLPPNAQNQGIKSRGCGAHGGIRAAQRSSRGTPNHGDALRMRSPHTQRSNVAPRTPGPGGGRGAGGGDDLNLQGVIGLRLNNRGNHCYANTLVLGLFIARQLKDSLLGRAYRGLPSMRAGSGPMSNTTF